MSRHSPEHVLVAVCLGLFVIVGGASLGVLAILDALGVPQ